MDEQKFYYHTLSGRLLGSLARMERVNHYLDLVQKNESVLEVGCCEGYYLDYIAEKTRRTAGVDVVEEKIEIARKRNKKTEFSCVSGTHLPYKENEFDWVLCTEVLEHIPEWKKSLNEIKRVASNKILLTIPLENARWWKTASMLGWGLESRGHVHAFDSKDIEAEMQGWTLKKKEMIFSPSRTLNKLIKNPKEKNSLYALLFYGKM